MPTLLVFLTAAIAGVAGGFVGGWYLGREQRLRRRIRAAPVFPIATWPEGREGRAVGVVRRGATLRAPLSGRACVYFRVVVEEPGGPEDWQAVIDERGGVAFGIDDGSGVAWVDPATAQVAGEVDRRSQSGAFEAATPEEQAFLTRHGRTPHDARGVPLPFRYREAVLEPGERVGVVGVGRREVDPDAAQGPGDRGAAATRLRIGRCADGHVYVSDHARETSA